MSLGTVSMHITASRHERKRRKKLILQPIVEKLLSMTGIAPSFSIIHELLYHRISDITAISQYSFIFYGHNLN